ncbi:MAG: hypothetical protein ACKVIG_06895, partial [Flavobacteriales bacterium]
HSDIIDYYSKFNTQRLKDNGTGISELVNKSKIFLLSLQKSYFLNILLELEKIEFDSTQFDRNAVVIDNLIDCLIPYLLHIGFSATSISDISYRYIKKKNALKSPVLIVQNFKNVRRKYCFLIKVEKGREEIKVILENLASKDVECKLTNSIEISKFLFDDFIVEPNQDLYIINHSTLDPHDYLRNIYELGLKNYVAKKDRLNLDFFTSFFDSVYWRFDKGNHKFQKSNISIDPINITKRKSTLITTIETLKRSLDFQFDKTEGIPFISEIRDSIYYYNLALGSKSIENSLSLLWTSLETLLPYRLKNNDIENVQYFVSKSIAIGSIGREVTSFANRMINTNYVNDSSLEDLGLYLSYCNYKPEGIKKWFEWLATEYKESFDPYDKIKTSSNLLCNKFCFLNETFIGKNGATVEYWLNKIKSSEDSIKYQLDRIYLHRNQIVHSGKFINEYSNLWSHLEWYVGKLLSYCVIEFFKLESNEELSKEKIFMQLEANNDMLINLLKNNRTRKINEVSFLYNQVCQESWMFF